MSTLAKKKISFPLRDAGYLYDSWCLVLCNPPERGGDQISPGGVTSRQTSSKQGMAGNNWRGLPKTGGAGEMLWMAYAPGGVKGLSK